VETVPKIFFVTKNSLARLFTPPFLLIYRGVNNGTDIYKPAFYSSRHGGQAV
jgi:hypothetical protein